jgi:phosphatidate cytidylyltransferase
MLKRVITGTVFGIVLIGGTLYNAYSFSLLFLTITLLGLWEFYNLAEKTNHQPQKITGLMLGALLFGSALFYFRPAYQHFSPIPLILLLPVLFSLFIFELYRKKTAPFGNIAYTLLGILYVALPFSLLCSFTPHMVLGILLIIWSSDTGAYFAGVSLGKHKLFERISPQKTWEGLFGGALLSLGVAYMVSRYETSLSLADWMVSALIIIIAGNLGDLAESLFKRSIDIKDSGTILPGHGGILDRFDSLILATPFIFTYLQLRHLF